MINLRYYCLSTKRAPFSRHQSTKRPLPCYWEKKVLFIVSKFCNLIEKKEKGKRSEPLISAGITRKPFTKPSHAIISDKGSYTPSHTQFSTRNQHAMRLSLKIKPKKNPARGAPRFIQHDRLNGVGRVTWIASGLALWRCVSEAQTFLLFFKVN